MPVHPAAKGAQDRNNPYMEGAPDSALEKAYVDMEEVELDVWDAYHKYEMLKAKRRGAYQRVLDLNGTLRGISERTHALEDEMKEEAKVEDNANPDYWDGLGVSFQRIGQRVQGK
jgi:hypothetical protein